MQDMLLFMFLQCMLDLGPWQCTIRGAMHTQLLLGLCWHQHSLFVA